MVSVKQSGGQKSIRSKIFQLQILNSRDGSESIFQPGGKVTRHPQFGLRPTVEPPNSHIFVRSKKRWLFRYFVTIWVREGYQKIKKLVFLSRRANHFLLFLKNPPSTQIVTRYPNSHTYPNSHRFFSYHENVTIWRHYSNYILNIW